MTDITGALATKVVVSDHDYFNMRLITITNVEHFALQCTLSFNLSHVSIAGATGADRRF